ncbi:DUF2726 domain-containing protein [Rhodobacter ferrooxidans]|uniref:DUF2726 domain-containing protein n=1 Tax=Rhodobacter ferrooxidans TaxID=371731 RepID=C8RYW6_9RHOB|nr:DUF2726 domain-containing protein [Rhodobacter sp. SW2]EEW25923.1 hypothetical protein Rsw2DRAFT_0994 [Rhodobacter sp. SW2]
MILQNPHFSALGNDPGLSAGLAVICLLLVGWVVTRFSRKRRRTPSLRSGPTPGRKVVPFAVPQVAAMTNPHAQMDAIAAVEFEVCTLLNREEARLLPVLESVIREVGDGHRVMAQTSLGEVIRPRQGFGSDADRQAAFASINSKRLDFAVFNRAGRLVAAIEYQGSGHYQNRAFLRDSVKREAVRKAGVPYIEVDANFTAGEVTARLRRILTANTLPPSAAADITVIESL